MFLFSSRNFGKSSNLTSRFVKWLETTSNYRSIKWDPFLRGGHQRMQMWLVIFRGFGFFKGVGKIKTLDFHATKR